MERGAVTVVCNLGGERMMFENPKLISLVMASRADVKRTRSAVVVPPDALAILSSEKRPTEKRAAGKMPDKKASRVV
jgi:hypothetical protein